MGTTSTHNPILFFLITIAVLLEGTNLVSSTTIVDKENNAVYNFVNQQKRTLTTYTPEDVSKNHDFIKCLSRGECGLENKCPFNLINTDLQDTSSNNYNVKGHIMVIKNSMGYNITFYWDILGTVNLSNNSGFKKNYGIIKSPPHSMTYFDTGFYGEHTVRLYVPANSTPTGDDASGDVAPNEYLESVQTLMMDDNSDCSRVQACRLLLNVCYGEVQERCPLYAAVCDNFSDEDEIAKESCIPECVYQYYAKEFKEWINIDSDLIVEYIKRGGGVKGSTIDGLCNTNPIVGLSILTFVLLVVSVSACYLAWVYRKSFKEISQQHLQQQQLGSNYVSNENVDDTNVLFNNTPLIDVNGW